MLTWPIVLFSLLTGLGVIGLYLSVAEKRTRCRIKLNLAAQLGSTSVKGKHMTIEVSGVLSSPITFHINPKGPDANGNQQEAPVSDIAWTLDTNTLLVVAANFGAVFTPTVAGTFNLAVTAKNSDGETLSDGGTITIVDDTPPPVIKATALNLAVG